MKNNIVLISNNDLDFAVLRRILSPKDFHIHRVDPNLGMTSLLLGDPFSVILADYDCIGEKTFGLLTRLQQNRMQTCLILYGEGREADDISEMLRAGAYAFISRSDLPERIHDTILAGLENQKALAEILEMIDELKDVNNALRIEREALRAKNSELDFINRLSRKVAYDTDWDRVLMRILDAGLGNVIGHENIGILYNIGSQWHLPIQLSNYRCNGDELERLKRQILACFSSLSGKTVSPDELSLQLHVAGSKVSFLSPVTFAEEWVFPLSVGGKPLGMLFLFSADGTALESNKKDLLITVSNILAISLKNAQEYHRLKEAAVTDGLTGILNHKGFKDFLQMEFQTAKRYNKPLSLIMIDTDNFKVINDSLGHQAGDYVLQELAGCLKGSVRDADVVARYGGDEFAILLPETDMGKSKSLVVRILENLEALPFRWGDKQIKVEISYGIASISELEAREGDEEFIHRADSRLYRAKRIKKIRRRDRAEQRLAV